MQVETNWYDERKMAVVIKINASLNGWQAFDEAVDTALDMARSVSHEVIILINPQGVPMPKKESPLPHLRRLFTRLPTNVKYVVGVLDKLGMFEKSIVDVLVKISFPGKLKMTTTLEEALKLIP